jgi:hypothetical protein
MEYQEKKHPFQRSNNVFRTASGMVRKMEKGFLLSFSHGRETITATETAKLMPQFCGPKLFTYWYQHYSSTA